MAGGYSKKEMLEKVVEALSPLGMTDGGYLRVMEVDSAGLSPAEMREKAVQLPAVFVSYAGSVYAPGQYLRMTETAGLDVSVVCTTGGTPDAGVVLDDVRGILCGATLGLSTGPLVLQRESRELATGQTTVMTARYVIRQCVYAGV